MLCCTNFWSILQNIHKMLIVIRLVPHFQFVGENINSNMLMESNTSCGISCLLPLPKLPKTKIGNNLTK